MEASGKQVEKRTAIAPSANDDHLTGILQSSETNLRYSNMSGDQLMATLRDVVNKDDPLDTYRLVKKIGQG